MTMDTNGVAGDSTPPGSGQIRSSGHSRKIRPDFISLKCRWPLCPMTPAIIGATSFPVGRLISRKTANAVKWTRVEADSTGEYACAIRQRSRITIKLDGKTQATLTCASPPPPTALLRPTKWIRWLKIQFDGFPLIHPRQRKNYCYWTPRRGPDEFCRELFLHAGGSPDHGSR